MEKTERLIVRLDPKLLEAAKKRAAETGEALSVCVRQLLREWTEQPKVTPSKN